MSTNQITMLIDTLSELQEQQAKSEVQTIQKKKPWYDFS